MARVPLSAEVARFIADRVARFPVDAPDRQKWLVNYNECLTHQALRVTTTENQRLCPLEPPAHEVA
jgi:hypothetical protein